MSEIREVSKDEASSIIETREPLGLFYLEEDGKFVGIDNSTGDAFVEEFNSFEPCERWLNGEEMESDDYRASIKNITTGEWLILEERGRILCGEFSKRISFYDEVDAESTLAMLNDMYEDCFTLILEGDARNE